MSIVRRIVLGIALLLAPSPGLSAIQSIETVPTGWRLENYIGDGIYVHYTGAACGGLHFGAGWSSTDRNRLWAVVSTGKVTGKVVGIRYDDATCEIASFFFRES